MESDTGPPSSADRSAPAGEPPRTTSLGAAPRPRRWTRRVVVGLAGATIIINALAWSHARAFTTFDADATSRVVAPQELSFGGRLSVLAFGARRPRPRNGRTPARPFETHLLRARDGVQLEAWRLPHPAPRAVVVCGHGYGGAKAALLGVADDLHALGLDVVLLDFRGSGGSAGDHTTIGVEEAMDVAAAAALARALVPGRPLLLHGVSMGAVAALRAVAVEGVVADGLILEAPFDRLLTTVEHRFEAMRVPPWPFARLLLFWGGVQRGFDPFAHDAVEYARAVRCPALVLGGGDDPWVRPDELRAVADALGAEASIFEGVRHEPLRERRPEAWRAQVSAFVNATLDGR
jgi:uncharacterized protein